MKTSANFIAVIPARAASTRLPGKMLADIAGLPMVIRTAQRAQSSQARQVYIATDDAEIYETAQQHQFQAVMTRADHASGTDRIAELCEALELSDDNIIVNVQGDEPLINPDLIDQVASILSNNPDADMATAACQIQSPEQMIDPDCVKVVCNRLGHALYFSRAAIPHRRDPIIATESSTPQVGLHHIGIYAYRSSFLKTFPKLAKSPLEEIESLEQLRALEHGYRILVYKSSEKPAPGIDNVADLERIRNFFKNQNQN